MKSVIHSTASAYRRVSRYFFYLLVVIGLMGTVTGVFAQSQQQSQLNLTLPDVKVVPTPLHQVFLITVSGTVTVQGSWTGGPLHFSGWAYVTGTDFGASYEVNFTISSTDFAPSSLNYPSFTNSSFSHEGGGVQQVTAYTLVINAYDQSNRLVATTGQQQGVGGGSSANLFILTMEIPLFQVPALGISANNPDFSNLFATFDPYLCDLCKLRFSYQGQHEHFLQTGHKCRYSP